MDKYGIVKLNVLAGKAEATHRSEMVTQLLFGEVFKIIKTKDNWYQVVNVADGYKCWILRGGFDEIPEEEYNNMLNHKVYLVPEQVNKLKFRVNEFFYIPAGSILPYFDHDTNHGIISGRQFTFEGSIVPSTQKTTAERVIARAQKFLNSPYLWGGKTHMGIDCSGLVQNAFRLAGMQLPRDAYQQAELGDSIKKVKDAHAGDLACFANAEGKITHVGIVMEGGKIIHASGRVKVCKLDEKGIFDEEYNDYTHKLALIKRVISSPL